MPLAGFGRLLAVLSNGTKQRRWQLMSLLIYRYMLDALEALPRGMCSSLMHKVVHTLFLSLY